MKQVLLSGIAADVVKPKTERDKNAIKSIIVDPSNKRNVGPPGNQKYAACVYTKDQESLKTAMYKFNAACSPI